MLGMGLLKDDKNDTSGRIVQAMFGLTPKVKAEARERVQQIQTALKSHFTVQSTSPPINAKPL
jgi:hypothetical protein